MAMKKIVWLMAFLVIVFATILPQTVNADGNVLTANGNSGTAMSTGYDDWQVASDSVPETISADYLQIEASWYSEAYDIYRAYLYFDIPDNVTVTSATLAITPKGVIYNQDNIRLMVLDGATAREPYISALGSIELSSLQENTQSSIVLDGSLITSGVIVLVTENELYKQAPLGWNWITLDYNEYRPTLTYTYIDKVIEPIVVSESPESSGMNYVAIVIGIIAVISVIGFVVWKTR
jgi:hypothetical protein